MAAVKNNVDIIKLPLTYKADSSASYKKLSPLRIACRLFKRNRIPSIKLLVQHAVDNSMYEGITGNSTLHVVVTELKFAKYETDEAANLIEEIMPICEIILNKRNKNNETALHICLEKEQNKYINRCVYSLLKAGSHYVKDDLQDQRVRNFHVHKMKLFQAVHERSYAILKKYEKCFFQLQDAVGNTPLHYACYTGPDRFFMQIYLMAPQALDTQNRFKRNPIENLLEHTNSLRKLIGFAYKIHEDVPGAKM